MAETATDVRGQAQEKAQQAQDKAQEVASKASDRARTQIDQRSTQLGERVGTTADDIRTVGQQLREQGKDQPAKLAEQAATRVERVGTWLRESDSDRMLSDIEDFGRRRPWAFAVGGMALGMVAARFLKASSTQRYEYRRQQQFTTHRAGNGHSPAYGRETTPVDPGTRTGVPTTSPAPADPARGLGITPPPPTGGMEGR